MQRRSVPIMRAAVYARVSTADQTCENQLIELRRYVEARGWTITKEFVDTAVSGTKERRPALDDLVRDAKSRRFDVVCAWRLDRLGRNLKHLVVLLEELQGLGIAFVSLGEGIDCTTPAGKLQLHILAALAAFERGRIAAELFTCYCFVAVKLTSFCLEPGPTKNLARPLMVLPFASSVPVNR